MRSFRSSAVSTFQLLALASMGCGTTPVMQSTFDGGSSSLVDGGGLGVPDVGASTVACGVALALADEGDACCPSLGADACGAGLFCASFDGRTIATCFRERSRLTGESCGDDRQCEHGSCNLELGRCRAAEGEVCTRTLGCGPSDAGGRQVCQTNGHVEDGVCQANTGESWARCAWDDDCLDGTCTHWSLRCGTGRPGDTCDDDDDCLGPPCLDHTCQAGRHGDLCTSDEHCSDGRCLDGVCIDGRDGDPCTTGAECDSFCNARTHRCGDRCTTPASCEAGLLCTRSGACAPPGALGEFEPCVSDAECASGSCYPYEAWDHWAGHCAPRGGDETACAVLDCAEEMTCDRDSRCRRRQNVVCGAYYGGTEGWQGACATGSVCDTTRDLLYRCDDASAAVCTTDADCLAGVRCARLEICMR